jgi:hypothetical protein
LPTGEKAYGIYEVMVKRDGMGILADECDKYNTKVTNRYIYAKLLRWIIN